MYALRAYHLKTLNINSLCKLLRKQDISDRIFFITGGNSGFGYLVSSIILKAGGTVIIGCRSKEKAVDACDRLQEETESEKISFVLVDMCNPQSVIDCVKEISKRKYHINVLINNAGVSLIQQYKEAPTGVVQLTELMTPLLLQEKSPRCVFISSLTYSNCPVDVDAEHLAIDKDHYKPFASYARSKYLVTSYCQYYARHHPEIFSVVCDPGVAATNIARELGCVGRIFSLHIFQLFAPTSKGACTIAFAGANKEISKTFKSGDMIHKCSHKELIPQVCSVDEQEAIFKKTMSVIDKISCS